MIKLCHLGFWVLLVSCTSPTAKEGLVSIISKTTFDEDNLIEKIYFVSSNPFSFKDIIQNLE